MASPIKSKTYADSLRYSLRGLFWALRNERNSLLFAVHLPLGFGICALFQSEPIMYLFTLVIVMGAMSAELSNTAMEHVVDSISKGEPDSDAGLTKDLAAGSVMPWGIAFIAAMSYAILTSPVLGEVLLLMWKMVITLLPVFLGGVTTMAVLRKTRILSVLAMPIDDGKVLPDGQRIFGDNKTWRGLLVMSVFCSVWQVVVNGVLRESWMPQVSHIAPCVPEGTAPILFDVLVGLVLGMTYMLCELPNSFAKRRFGIDAGNGSTEGTARQRMIAFFVDHIDSSVGVCLVICLIAHLGFGEYLTYLAVSFAMHVLANGLLRVASVRDSF